MSSYNSKVVDVEVAPPVTGNVTVIPTPLALRAEYDGNSLLIYFGDATSGSLTSAGVWRIRKLTYDGNGNFVSMTWPNGVVTSTFVWDLRSTYSYS